MDKLSQKIAVLKYMQEHGSITPMEALKHIGSFRLGARIYDLKGEGHDIINLNKTGEERFAKYQLVEKRLKTALELKIELYKKLQSDYPRSHNNYDKIQVQIDNLSKGSGVI